MKFRVVDYTDPTEVDHIVRSCRLTLAKAILGPVRYVRRLDDV